MKFKTKGVCCQSIDIEINNDNVLTSVSFMGGCNGNASGVAKLVEGLTIDQVIDKLEGITCGYRNTSCPDQLAKALKEIKMQKS